MFATCTMTTVPVSVAGSIAVRSRWSAMMGMLRAVRAGHQREHGTWRRAVDDREGMLMVSTTSVPRRACAGAAVTVSTVNEAMLVPLLVVSCSLFG
jgi:hypothetical protein